MTNAGEPLDPNAIRERVRAAQHGRSFPLLVIGVLLVNYGAVNFSDEPLAWRYAAPLAFLGVWLLFKLNETRVGVGTPRADYLVAAGVVFTATSLTVVRPFSEWLYLPSRLAGVWLVIVGLTLIILGWFSTDPFLMLAGAGVVGAGIVNAAMSAGAVEPGFGRQGVLLQPWPYILVAAVGALITLGGLVSYRQEEVQRG